HRATRRSTGKFCVAWPCSTFEPLEPTMIRTLLTTTAVAMLMGTASFAQTTPAPAETPAAPAAEAPATTPADATTPAQVNAAPVDTGAAEETDVHEPWDLSQGYV